MRNGSGKVESPPIEARVVYYRFDSVEKVSKENEMRFARKRHAGPFSSTTNRGSEGFLFRDRGYLISRRRSP
jgi:hypothetical protein